jgi:acyl-CoA dehydrogenase
LTFPRELIARASELGLRTLKVPVEYGGLGAGCLTEVLVLEELCVGDVGFGMTLQHAWREGYMLAAATTPSQRERFLPDFLADDTYVLSFAITESHSGSDVALPYAGDIAAGPQTRATRAGDSWIINGSKAFVSNTNVGRLILLFARTNPDVPWTSGISCFLVPNDHPGVRVDRVEDKLGIRLNQNAGIVFEDCRIPADNLLGELNKGVDLMKRFAIGSKTKEGAKCLGIARAALQEATAWALEASTGGSKPISMQSTQTALADMAAEIEAARSLMWRSAWTVDNEPENAAPLEDMVKVLTANVAVNATSSLIDLLGPLSLISGGPSFKLLRDAVSMMHAGGGNHAIRARLGAQVGSMSGSR